jgi:hypothetical protein
MVWLGKYTLAFMLLALFSTAILSQAPPKAITDPVPAISGSLEGRTYKNDFFGFTLQLPNEGVILSGPETEVFKNAGKDLLKTDSEQHNKLVETSLAKEVVLLTYASVEIGSPENSMFVLGTEKQPVGATPNLTIAATVRALVGSGKFELTKTLNNRRVGGKVTAGIEGKLAVGAQKLLHRIYVFMVRGYSVDIATASHTAEGLDQLEKIIDTLHFKEK